jgi:hypothetical protein
LRRRRRYASGHDGGVYDNLGVIRLKELIDRGQVISLIFENVAFLNTSQLVVEKAFGCFVLHNEPQKEWAGVTPPLELTNQ